MVERDERTNGRVTNKSAEGGLSSRNDGTIGASAISWCTSTDEHATACLQMAAEVLRHRDRSFLGWFFSRTARRLLLSNWAKQRLSHCRCPGERNLPDVGVTHKKGGRGEKTWPHRRERKTRNKLTPGSRSPFAPRILGYSVTLTVQQQQQQ